MKPRNETELERVTRAYQRRVDGPDSLPVERIRLDRERHYAAFLDSPGLPARSDLRVLEVGCGSGGELNRLIGLGLEPENLEGIDLLEDRISAARKSLPDEVGLRCGDATRMEFDDDRFDVVFTSLVFTSILSDEIQARLAREMMRVLRPAGIILWYDFLYDNPRNADVRGVPIHRIQNLFPDMEISVRRTTLAPPIARVATRFGVPIYRLLHLIPMLRSHVVAAIRSHPPSDRT